MRRVLLTDVDNTLFSWIDYFAPCFRALIHAVSRTGNIPEDALYDSFQMIFQREGTVEYRHAIQENLLVRELPKEVQEKLLHVGTVAFSRAQRHHLHPYPTVKETLQRLREDGVLIVAVTNSGALQAIYRLRQLGLSKLLDGLIAWDHNIAGLVETDDDYQAALRDRLKRSGLPWASALPRGELKPEVTAYESALRHLGIREASIWIVGDSLHKDLSAAPIVGAKSVWARYGHEFDSKNFETLRRITHWSAEKIEATYDTTGFNPDYSIDIFQQLLTVVEIRQGLLF